MTECSPPTMCHMSGVRCQVSGAEASRWRVCYQRGLPRLVLIVTHFLTVIFGCCYIQIVCHQGNKNIIFWSQGISQTLISWIYKISTRNRSFLSGFREICLPKYWAIARNKIYLVFLTSLYQSGFNILFLFNLWR